MDAVKYVHLYMSENTIKRECPVNAMVMVKNRTAENLMYDVTLYIRPAEGGAWKKCTSRTHELEAKRFTHAYLTIPAEAFCGSADDEYIIYAGDTPPETKQDMRGISDMVTVV